MNNGITKDNMIFTLPPPLKEDDSTEALAEATAELLETRKEENDRLRIYPEIGRIPEGLADILAYDFKVDWYNYNYSLESKRALILSNFYVHRHLGTPQAVNRMLSSVFPGSYIEEWFQYGGTPHHFQIILEMRDAKEIANAKDILDAVGKVKRLSSHLDGLVYQCQIGIVIGTRGRGYRYRTPRTGRTICGTEPARSTRAGIGRAGLEIESGERPFTYTAPMAGTEPWRATRAGTDDRDMEVGTGARGWPYHTPATGKAEAGTKPKRDMAGVVRETSPVIDAEGAGWPYTAPSTGKLEAGTSPARSTDGAAQAGAFYADAEGEGFRYHVKWCGTSFCKS